MWLAMCEEGFAREMLEGRHDFIKHDMAMISNVIKLWTRKNCVINRHISP